MTIVPYICGLRFELFDGSGGLILVLIPNEVSREDLADGKEHVVQVSCFAFAVLLVAKGREGIQQNPVGRSAPALPSEILSCKSERISSVNFVLNYKELLLELEL